MTIPGLTKGLPDINASYLVGASAATTVIVWGLTLDGVMMPPDVASAVTTLIALGVGVWKGNGYRRDRRATDAH
jgi:hypothetical protein